MYGISQVMGYDGMGYDRFDCSCKIVPSQMCKQLPPTLLDGTGEGKVGSNRRLTAWLRTCNTGTGRISLNLTSHTPINVRFSQTSEISKQLYRTVTFPTGKLLQATLLDLRVHSHNPITNLYQSRQSNPGAQQLCRTFETVSCASALKTKVELTFRNHHPL